MRTRMLASVLATALLAAGCATVPTKGPIRNSGQDGPAPAQGGIGVEARPPRDKAQPLQLVNGFLEAMSDSGAFDVAREYLTPEAAAKWDPESKISVYDQSSPSTVTSQGRDRVRLAAPLIGTIDRRGSWTPAKKGTEVDFTFQLVQVEDQLRVSNPPQGVFLGSNQLEPKLAPRSLYFFNPSKGLLVPDPLFLPINLTPGQAATQLIQELLKGPTSRLGNGVVSAAPPGTTVNVSVPVDDGIATVALSDTAGALVESDRQKLAAQIAWTLRLITNRVRITVGGAPLLPDSEVLSLSDFGEYDPTVQDLRMKDLHGLQNGKIQRILGQDGGQEIAVKPITGSALFSGYQATAFAVNLRSEKGAVVTTTRGGTPIVVTGLLDSSNGTNDEVQTVPAAGKVLRPSWDDDDSLWILDRADGPSPRLRVRTLDGKISNVLADFGNRTPLTLRMAPDGVRALLVLRDKKTGQTSVETATIQTNEAKQLVLAQFRPLNLSLDDITDASWNNLGVLVAGKSAPGEQARPWQVNADGSQLRLIPGASSEFEAVEVASNPNLDTLPVVQDAEGRLHWQKKDLTWVTMTEDPDAVPIDPVYPG